ncbi:metallophosphoesterase [Cytophagaceae bacterium ABcell3]|nr:metallophosphoesterase [Cytophagaceae bacterium ABcell3]
MANFAISDIHGCNKSFLALLKKLNLRKGDTLYLLGDLINKGPDSIGVLNTVLELIRNKIDVKPLKGNHEQMLIDVIRIGQPKINPFVRKMLNLEKESAIPEHLLEWISQWPYFYENDHFVFVHAGLNFEIENVFDDLKSMVYIRDNTIMPEKIDHRRLIHGHTPQTVLSTQKQIDNMKPAINIDGGCVMYRSKKLAHLMALDLDFLHLIVQPNIDHQPKAKLSKEVSSQL